MNLDKRLKAGQAIVNEEAGKLEFTDLRFWIDDRGLYWPSTTTYLDVWPKGKGYEMWLKDKGDDADRIMEDAGLQGSRVHAMTEMYDNGVELNLLDADGMKYSSTEWNMLEKYADFSNKVNPEIVFNELKIVVPEMRVGGVIDRVVRINGKLYILDIKTSKAIYDSYWLQLACYAKMYQAVMGEQIEGLCICWLNANTRTEKVDFKKMIINGRGWQLCFPEKDIDHYWKLFTQVQDIWWEVNGDVKPRHVSYNLTIKK